VSRGLQALADRAERAEYLLESCRSVADDRRKKIDTIRDSLLRLVARINGAIHPVDRDWPELELARELLRVEEP
jgi:hypothetical protein